MCSFIENVGNKLGNLNITKYIQIKKTFSYFKSFVIDGFLFKQ